MQVGFELLAVFLIMAALMYTRRISALLALPLMAVLIAVIGALPGEDIVDQVLTQGATRLNIAYTTTMFGAVLAELINRHGIARAMVRWVAEFSGDSPFLLALMLTLITALLFSSMGGLGAVIMVGTVVLPVMLSIGIPAATAGGLYLFGISLGGMFNLGNWALYIDVLRIGQPAIISYVVPFAACVAFVVMLFLLWELKTWRNAGYALAFGVLLAAAFGAFVITQAQGLDAAALAPPKPHPASLYGAAAVIVLLLVWAAVRQKRKSTTLPSLAFLAPCIPLILVLGFQWPIIPSFVAGILFAVLITWQRGSVNILTRSIIDGISTVAPAVALMIGIGMLLNAVMHPNIATAIQPLLRAVVPNTALPYIIIFTVLAPLSLYRGPLSLFGMGAGLVGLILETKALAARAIMAMLMSVGQIQGVSDPTNTHNVWIATYLGTDTQVLLRKTIPFAWIAVVTGLCLAVAFGYVPWRWETNG